MYVNYSNTALYAEHVLQLLSGIVQLLTVLVLFFVNQGLKKALSGCLGQIDFPVGQVTFHSHLPDVQGIRQVVCQLNHEKSKLRLAQGKQNL